MPASLEKPKVKKKGLRKTDLNFLFAHVCIAVKKERATINERQTSATTTPKRTAKSNYVCNFLRQSFLHSLQLPQLPSVFNTSYHRSFLNFLNFLRRQSPSPASGWCPPRVPWLSKDCPGTRDDWLPQTMLTHTDTHTHRHWSLAQSSVYWKLLELHFHKTLEPNTLINFKTIHYP